jgi:hypothetical protein
MSQTTVLRYKLFGYKVLNIQVVSNIYGTLTQQTLQMFVQKL